MKTKLLISIEEKETDQVPTTGDESWWEKIPSFTIPQPLINGVAMSVNVKGPEDPETKQPKFVRVIRTWLPYADKFVDRIDCMIDPENDMFKPEMVVSGVTSIDNDDDLFPIPAEILETIPKETVYDESVEN